MKPILALETSTSRCGVAVMTQQHNEHSVIVREVDGVSGHAEILLPLVQTILNITETEREQLGGIAFGQGPGAFTGLRVACGAAQGIGFALGIPVVPVGALTALAAAMEAEYGLRLVALDARMNEVYFAAWVQMPIAEGGHIFSETLGLMPLQAPVLIAAQDLVAFILQRLPYWYVALDATQQIGSSQIGLSGNGWRLLGDSDQWFDAFRARCNAVSESSRGVNLCDDFAIPQVAWVARLGAAGLKAGKGLKPEQASPFYLRDKVAFTSLERAQGLGGNPKAINKTAGSQRPLLLPMLSADLSEVAELEQMSQSFPWSKQNFADALAAGYPSWVIRTQSQLVGFCVAMMSPDDVHILVIAINANNRRTGLASLILHAVQQLAVQSGLNRILLEVRPSNEQALAFYHRCGFEQMGVRKGYYPAGKNGREDAWVLAVTVDRLLIAGSA